MFNIYIISSGHNQCARIGDWLHFGQLFKAFGNN